VSKTLFGGVIDGFRSIRNQTKRDGRLREQTPDSPIPYAGRFGNRGQRTDNPTAQMEAMGSVGTLFAIVSRITDSFAQVDWQLFNSSVSGKDEDRTQITAHAALDLWNRPNVFYTGRHFRETYQQHLELVGETFWIIVSKEFMGIKFPLEIWPIRPDMMTVVASPTKFINGYIYNAPDGAKVPLEIDDVIHMKMPNPVNPFRGMGPVQAILHDIDSSRFSAEWNKNFFINGATPGGIIEVEKRLSDDEWDEMVMRWREQHQGVANAHRVAVIEQGKWVDAKFSMRDMQFKELREVSREIIREAYAYPKSMLGTVDDVNRANADAGEVVFARWMNVPRLNRTRDILNGVYITRFSETGKTVSGLNREFDYANPVPINVEQENDTIVSKANAAGKLVKARYHPDDVTQVVGLPKMRHLGDLEPQLRGDQPHRTEEDSRELEEVNA
jgi:HK97 family phage portal protein